MTKIADWTWVDKTIVTSTNDEALSFSNGTKDEKFIISSQEQKQGRGRRGRYWTGLKGNLFFSQGIQFDSKYIGHLIFISSLSLYQAIHELLPKEHNLCIKWPNDVLINNCKVSGILIEKGYNDYYIIGIGVNICDFPKLSPMLYPTTSLKDNGINIDRLAFMKSYINKFDNNYKIWKISGFDEIREQWLLAVKGLGESINVKLDNKELNGIFEGIGSQGELLLKSDGKSHKIYAGDIFYTEKE